MKKVMTFLCVTLTLFALFTVFVFAEESSPEIIFETESGEQSELPDETGKTTDDTTWFEEAWNFVKENIASLTVMLSTIYLIFPKFGGVAKLLSYLRAFKLYMDDKNNKDSVYNVMARSATTISAFMKEASPILESLKSGNMTVTDLAEEMKRLASSDRAILEANIEAIRLMAKQLNDFVGMSTTISAKRKAEIEDAWLEGDRKIAGLLSAVTEVEHDEHTESKSA